MVEVDGSTKLIAPASPVTLLNTFETCGAHPYYLWHAGHPAPEQCEGCTRVTSQDTYLKALGTLPNLHVHFGNFQVTNSWMPLAQPLQFWPTGLAPFPVPDSVCVLKTEEKGSDVNLGVHLVRDGFMGAFEHAVIVTNDTDLKEPLRLVVQEAKLPSTLLTPSDHPAASLAALATHVRHLSPYLGVSQFPDTVIGKDGKPSQSPPTGENIAARRIESSGSSPPSPKGHHL